MRLRWMLDAVVDLHLPLTCPLCKAELDRSDPNVACSRSGRPVAHEACLEGLRVEPRIALGFARFSETVPVASYCLDSPEFFVLLHRAKYQGDVSTLHLLCERMAEVVELDAAFRATPPVVVAVPDEPSRLLQRGFSVVGTIADNLCAVKGWSRCTFSLRRRGGGHSQTSCADDVARRQNVAGRFRTGDLARVPRSRPILLIEDQVTSGATAREVLRLLGARGNPLAVLALARSARVMLRLGA